MQVTRRIALLVDKEHRFLREAIPATEAAILAIPAPVARKTPVPAPPRGGRPQDKKSALAPPKPFNPRALRDAWDNFKPALADHMLRERACFDMIHKMYADPRRRKPQELDLTIAQLTAEHVQLRRLAGLVRIETVPTEAAVVRKQVVNVLDLFETITRAEEFEIYPGVEAGETPVQVMRQRTSDAMLRTLRAPKAEDTDDETSGEYETTEDTTAAKKQETAGLFSKIKSIFGR
jgi:hypothetical protein